MARRVALSVRESGVLLMDRPRERLLTNGPNSLSSTELLAVVLAGGSASGSAAHLAVRLMGEHESLFNLSRADPLELTSVPGIGPARAAQLAAAFELGRRSTSLTTAGARWVIRAPGDIWDRLVPDMAGLEKEELRVLALNTKNVVLRSVTVYQGNVSGAVVRIAELFRDAIRINAAGIILVHNHPSGDPEPSPDDLQLTAEAVAAGRLLDIAVLDHVIVAAHGHVSLRDRGVGFDR